MVISCDILPATGDESLVTYFVWMVISCDILPATGDESLVTDFVPVSPPRHLHPDTGELVVKPDAVQSCPPRNKKVKDKKGQGDGMERKAEKNVTETSEETFYMVLPSVIFFYIFLHLLECVDVAIKCLFFGGGGVFVLPAP